ncbi:MAG: FemAB family PEP-CTERM system-associated protein [Planctomycetes bacterium]|nr:FemAB family PEP-CTERM system-associated protein [Planctomycetota bacterium]
MASNVTAAMTETAIYGPAEIAGRLERWTSELQPQGVAALSYHPGWLLVLQRGLKQQPFCVEAVRAGRCVGILPLSFVKSLLFGRFLVSMPYLNVGGVLTADEEVAAALIDRAVELADLLNVRYLELRHEQEHPHAALRDKLTSKVHMRLPLPGSSDELWKKLDPKVRNQVRKGQQHELNVHWGGQELLGEFYSVFSHNMRDLGTPAFGRGLFEAVLTQFPGQAELCVVRQGTTPVASALLTHGGRVTEVPSASSLRAYNSTNANMLMYWHLLCRAIERGQATFDFGRSSQESGTFRFKKQWGAEPWPAVWQYYVRKGSVGDMRPDNRKFGLMIRMWQRLPLGVTRLVGPWIVRGIP